MKTKIPAGEKLTIGLDLGDRRHHACLLDEAGEILAEEVIVNTREVLTVLFAEKETRSCDWDHGLHRDIGAIRWQKSPQSRGRNAV